MYRIRLAQRSVASRQQYGRNLHGGTVSCLSSFNIFVPDVGVDVVVRRRKGVEARAQYCNHLQCHRWFSSSLPRVDAVTNQKDYIDELEGVSSQRKDDDFNHNKNKPVVDEKDQMTSPQQEEKRKRAARRIACQSIPFWLKTERYCFEQTVSALNLNISNERYQTGESFIAMSDLPGQYRQAFKDSIPSYMDVLQVGNNLPKPVEDALDRLAQAGFDDTDFARDYRSLKGNQIQFARTTVLLQQKQEKLNKRKETVRIIEENVEVLQAEMKELVMKREALEKSILQEEVEETSDQPEESKQDNVNPINSVLSILKAAANLTLSGKDETKEQLEEQRQKQKEKQEEATKRAAQQRHELVMLEQRISRLERQIAGRRTHIKQHERGSQNAVDSIEEIKRQQTMAQSTMATEVYEATQKVVKEAMLVICDALADHIQTRHSKLIETYQALDAKTDLTKPHEWYPYARLDKRKIIYHGGPTNSGKTYNALQRLKQAKRGMYLGPLRLLAAEVYEKLNSEGVYTSLITGQERREFPFSTHIAATVEMAASLIEEEFDVIVIDEIQMIEDEDRGFAWTRGLLGMRCKEIHVCGGLEAKKIIERIVKACGDDFELHQYERFSALEVASDTLASQPDQVGAYSEVRPGDCVVAFSRTDIFAIKREIEASTPYKCCVVYGTLPPNIRTAQAQLFNDPNSGFDILVASDAISMGLNLNIRRIIFNSIYKNNGTEIVRLGHSAVKQIAGRAGRRNSPFPNGEVTCRDPRDLEYIQECLRTEIKPIEKAGLIPTGAHVELFGEALQQYHYGTNVNEEGEEITPHLHTTLKEFSDMAVVKGDFFLCRQGHMYQIAKWLKDIPLETKIKYDFCMAPLSSGNQYAKDIVVKFGQKLGAGDVPGMGRGLPLKRAVSFDDMATLCSMYSEVELFLWLQNKFPPANLMEQQAALSRKENVASLITLGLQEAERLKLDHCYVRRDVSLRKQVGISKAQEEVDEENDHDNVLKNHNDDDFSQSDDEDDDDYRESRRGRRSKRRNRL